MRLLADAAFRDDTQRRLDRLHDLRAAQIVDGRKFTEYARALERSAKRQPRKNR